jgi:3-oxoacyl-[acyl-carrier-protein] synthase III
MNAEIKGISSYAPSRIIDNSFFEKIIETSDEWIVSRTGIKERRFAEENEFTSDVCVSAARNLIKENPDLTLGDVDFIITATTTADQVMPSTASQIQNKLGIKDCGTLDVAAACAGFVYGIILAKGLIAAGSHKKVLVFGAETLSKFSDLTDRTTCILFGDGAGVAMVEASEKGNISASITGTEGSGGKDLYISQNASKINDVPVDNNGKIHQNGKVVFKWAVQTVSEKIKELLAKSSTSLKDIDWIILHSANLRIIEAVAREIDFPVNRMPESIQYYGNTSSASIPLAWHTALKDGRIKKGDKILLMGFGGGLTYAGCIVTS